MWVCQPKAALPMLGRRPTTTCSERPGTIATSRSGSGIAPRATARDDSDIPEQLGIKPRDHIDVLGWLRTTVTSRNSPHDHTPRGSGLVEHG